MQGTGARFPSIMDSGCVLMDSQIGEDRGTVAVWLDHSFIYLFRLLSEI